MIKTQCNFERMKQKRLTGLAGKVIMNYYLED